MRRSDWPEKPDPWCHHDATPPEYVWKIDDESEIVARPMRIQRCVKCNVRITHILDDLTDIDE